MTGHNQGWRKVYADLVKCYNVGYGAVFGRFSGVLNIVMIGSTYLLVKGFELGFVETISVGVGLLISLLIAGFIYLKVGLQKAEFSSNVKEQPEIYDMYNKINEMYTVIMEDKNKKKGL